MVVIAAVSGVGLVVDALVGWQALRGQPLTDPDGATLAAAGLILGATTAGAYAALRKSPSTTDHRRSVGATERNDDNENKELVA